MIVDDLFEAGGPRIPGYINKATGNEWSRDELLAKKPIKVKRKPAAQPASAPSPADIFAQTRKAKQQAAGAAAQAQMAQQPPVAEPLSISQKRQARQAQAAAAAQDQMAGTRPVVPVPTTPNYAKRLPGYSDIKMNAPAATGVPNRVFPNVSVSPGVLRSPPRVVSGGPTPAERQALEKRIAAAAKAQPAIAECITTVSKMLEAVTSKKDVSVIREYIDSKLTQTNQQEFRRALHEKVTVAAALRRRLAAQQAAN